jgi:hypothetical protein
MKTTDRNKLPLINVEELELEEIILQGIDERRASVDRRREQRRQAAGLVVNQ